MCELTLFRSFEIKVLAFQQKPRGSAPQTPGIYRMTPRNRFEIGEETGLLQPLLLPGPRRCSGRIPALPHPPLDRLMVRQSTRRANTLFTIRGVRGAQGNIVLGSNATEPDMDITVVLNHCHHFPCFVCGKSRFHED